MSVLLPQYIVIAFDFDSLSFKKSVKMAESDDNIRANSPTMDEVDVKDAASETSIKPVRLSIHLLVRRNLCKDASGVPQDEIISELNQVKRIRLDRENIGEIDGLELLSSNVTHLYLQKNIIQCIENLEYLPNLQVLVLSNNAIKTVEGISHLQKLVFLDMSENLIENVDVEEIPKSVVILNFSGNKCVENSNHREILVTNLPKLKTLDGCVVSHVGPEYKSESVNDGDEEDDEESEDDETEPQSSPPIVQPIPVYSQLSGYKQLPKIGASIQDFATEMLLRSQARLEETMGEHKQHCQAMINSRIKAKLRPCKSINKECFNKSLD